MDASTLPKGKSLEVNGDGRPVNQPGIYKNKESGAKVITVEGDAGIIQADAIMRTGGYERIADVPTRVELLAMQKAQEVKDVAAEALQKGQEAAELKAAVKEATEAAKATA